MPTLTPAVTPVKLSPRLIQIAEHLAAGDTNDQISRRLRLSASGTQSAVRRLLAATGTTSRTQAALWALENGLVPTPTGKIMVDAGALADLLAAMEGSPANLRRQRALAAAFIHHHPVLAETARRRAATLPAGAPHRRNRSEVAP